MTKEEKKEAEIALIYKKITSRASSGGGSSSYDAVDPKKLAEFLYSIAIKTK